MFNIEKENVLAAFKYRRATRNYDASKKISDEDFAYILELARLSPSSVGSEPWKFVVIQNQELRNKLKPVAWGMAAQMDAASHDSEYFKKALEQRGLTAEEMEKTLALYKQFHVEDIKIAGNERALFDWCSKQTYIALGNMMSGAAMIGIDSCPIEGFNYDAVNKILAEAGAFDPNEYGVSVMATFGYRAGAIAPKSRKPIEEIVSWIK
ncbi:NAD(P)H-dependent oxidoreductase [Actinobacillus pleuropneumoniae]|uniref:NAD(P)H-dependent oxidoreductase n=1 Tax=Actinobacillus pleuropneumoniae TaxID=715 RepID=UPI003B02947F